MLGRIHGIGDNINSNYDSKNSVTVQMITINCSNGHLIQTAPPRIAAPMMSESGWTMISQGRITLQNFTALTHHQESIKSSSSQMFLSCSVKEPMVMM